MDCLKGHENSIVGDPCVVVWPWASSTSIIIVGLLPGILEEHIELNNIIGGDIGFKIICINTSIACSVHVHGESHLHGSSCVNSIGTHCSVLPLDVNALEGVTPVASESGLNGHLNN